MNGQSALGGKCQEKLHKKNSFLGFINVIQKPKSKFYLTMESKILVD